MLRLFLILIVAATLGQGADHFKYSHLRNNGRIVGGVETTIEENPWQISLELFGLHSCGGSITGPNTVVTAAHCIDGLQFLEEIVSGTTDLLQNGTRSRIAEAIVHPLYDGLDYDVAIIKLTENLTYSDKIQPIALPDSEPPDNSTVRVTGWGLESEGGIITPNILRTVDVDIVNREICALNYSGVEGAAVTERMICAGVREGGKDACQGDSGGPLSIDGVLFGIVSWGLGCGQPGYPGVYTNVFSVVDFIRENQ